MFDITFPGPAVGALCTIAALATALVLVTTDKRLVFRRQGRRIRASVCVVVLTATSLAALLALWVAWKRLLPWDTEVKVPIVLVLLFGSVATFVPMVVWVYVKRSQRIPGRRAAAFYKTSMSLIFLAAVLSISALLFQNGSKLPVTSAAGPQVAIATHGANQVRVTAKVADYLNLMGRPDVPIGEGGPLRPTPVDQPVGRMRMAINLSGQPGASVRFAIQADRRAVGNEPQIFGEEEYSIRPLTDEDRFLAFRGAASPVACKPAPADAKTGVGHWVPPSNAVLITGSAILNDEGIAELLIIQKEPRAWYDASGSVNTVRLPDVATFGVVPRECMTGTGGLEGYWVQPVTTSIEIDIPNVVTDDYSRLETFPKVNESQSISRLHWTATSLPGRPGTGVAPYYIIESPSTKDRASSQLFLAAVLLGGALTVVYELVRDLPPEPDRKTNYRAKRNLGAGSKGPRIRQHGGNRKDASGRRATFGRRRSDVEP